MKDGKENVGDDRKEMAEVDREAGNEEEEGGRWKGKIGDAVVNDKIGILGDAAFSLRNTAGKRMD